MYDLAPRFPAHAIRAHGLHGQLQLAEQARALVGVEQLGGRGQRLGRRAGCDNNNNNNNNNNDNNNNNSGSSNNNNNNDFAEEAGRKRARAARSESREGRGRPAGRPDRRLGAGQCPVLRPHRAASFPSHLVQEARGQVVVAGHLPSNWIDQGYPSPPRASL